MYKMVRSKVKTLVLIALAVLIAAVPVFGKIGEAAFAEDKEKYVFGSAEVCSTFNKEMLKDSFYYTDGWFSEEPEKENDELALISMQLVGSLMDDKEDGSGATFLKKLGFSDIGSYGMYTDDPDDCAYMYGKKKIGDETLIAVVIQSYSFSGGYKLKGWSQNFTVNGEAAKGEHEGLSKAAESVLGKVAELSDGADGNVKYWITGHSRGGAIAGLLSAKLPGALAVLGRNSKIFTYTFESPAVVDEDYIDNKEKYGYIHNFSCSDDIVTMVPPSDWKMTVYGVKHELKNEETDANLNEELKKLGSKAKLAEDSSLGDHTAEYIIGKLVSRMPDRKNYTEVRRDSFTTSDGQKHTIEYTPQGTFLKLMELIFGDNKISIAGLASRIGEAGPMLDAYIRAYMMELGKLEDDGYHGDVHYFMAAEALCDFLKPEEGELPFDEKDAYALLKLAAPVLVDPDAGENDEAYAIADETLTFEKAVPYIEPGIAIAMGADELTFSHHFDTCYGRLKTLAPAPEMSGVGIEISEPAAGDAVSKAPRDVEKAVSELGFHGWMLRLSGILTIRC